jgi:hypothetical protein
MPRRPSGERVLLQEDRLHSILGQVVPAHEENVRACMHVSFVWGDGTCGRRASSVTSPCCRLSGMSSGHPRMNGEHQTLSVDANGAVEGSSRGAMLMQASVCVTVIEPKYQPRP